MNFWKAAFILALVAGLWLRFADLGLKPLHHDEGVNSYFLLNLADHNDYKYNPENYHGPTLYYFTFIFLKLFGERDLALRFWPALCGAASIALVWWLRRDIGVRGAAIAAFLIALSPGLVYFSRDFIHEMTFVFFGLAIVVSIREYRRTTSFAWTVIAAIAAGLLFATKETAMITVVVLVLAALSAIIIDELRSRIRSRSLTLPVIVTELRKFGRSLIISRDHLLAAALIFIAVNVIFYTSIFMNWRGIIDAFASVVMWSKRSGGEHVHAFDYYIGIIAKLELPLLVISLIAGVVIVWKGSRFALFLAAWALGMALSYSLIPYKTPWLVLSILLPMALAAGAGMDILLASIRSRPIHTLVVVVLLGTILMSGVMSWRVNFRSYDDNDNKEGYLVAAGKRLKLRPYTDGQYGYVYAQTDREILQLVDAVKNESGALGSGDGTTIYVSSPAYWPLPWYLRRYNNAAFSGELPENLHSAVVQQLLIANDVQKDRIESDGGWRRVTSPITLRPGERLLLYQREPQ